MNGVSATTSIGAPPQLWQALFSFTDPNCRQRLVCEMHVFEAGPLFQEALASRHRQPGDSAKTTGQAGILI